MIKVLKWKLKKKKKKTDKKDGDLVEELSEEDKKLQEDLIQLVEVLKENDQTLYRAALEQLRSQIRSSTTSMTSVPKPLKFLRPHYDEVKLCYEKIVDTENKKFCADVISVLAMTASEKRECLKFRLLGSFENIGSWGHEYVRHITGEVCGRWQELEKESTEMKEIQNIIDEIIPYLMQHNAEAEACDALMEMDLLSHLHKHVTEDVYKRVCLYLTSCIPYVPEPENGYLLDAAMGVYKKFKKYPEAMRLAIQTNNIDIITETFMLPDDLLMQKQLAYMLGRQHIFLELNEEIPENEELIEIMSNAHLNNNFLALARELDILEPKIPEDIYKSHLEPNRTVGPGNVDSARQNLAASFVNGFVNTAFGKDKLLEEDGNKWLYKNKDHGMMSATATFGLILLWDVEGGLSQIDKYLYSQEDYIKAGALLACGIVNSCVKNECDPARALLSDYVLHESNTMRVGSIIGLGLAYAGSNREDIISLLTPAIFDSKSSMEVICMSALACGMIAVASGNGEVSEAILHYLTEERQEKELNDTHAKFLALGLGLTYLGRQDMIEAVSSTLTVISEPYRSMAMTLVDICAYAGTGNVLKIQNLLHICSEHHEIGKESESDKKKDDKSKEDKTKNKKKDEKDSEKKDDKKEDKKVDLTSQQSVAVIGIALIAMGEEIGSDMCYRSLGHLLRYGEPVIRRAVPLALALISASNPKLQILDTLSKFSHDQDSEVAHNAILAMGIVGAGTNNARLAAMLRQLAIFHAKDANNLFCVRIAQGLTHLGKGTLTLCPFHSDRTIMSPVAVAGLLAFLVACLDVKNIILGKSHYIMYHLVAAMQPRMVVTFDEELNPLPVSVRVGQAIDVVGQAGKPKTITGFQTHTTPVLLAYGERAELATEEYTPLSPILEGFVILRKNPEE